MKPAVSIVVPVYNVEKYIDRCINSLVSQTLTNVEIILVDDGSPDRCSEICEQWAKKDGRIVVIHKMNGGLSSARNAGIESAKGKYIGFVDSDDDVELDMFERMLSVAEDNKVDFVMADYLRVLTNGERYLKTLDIETGLYDKEKIRKVIFPNLIMRECIDYGPLLSVCHCIYNTDFLKKNDLKFDEEVRWSEDNIFSAILGYQANSFYYMKGEGLYHYHQNPGTITTSYRKSAWKVYCTMNDHLRDFFEQITDYDFSRQLNLHMIYYACNCIGMECSREKEEALQEIEHILHDDKLVSAFRMDKMPAVPIKLKLQLLLMKYHRSKLLYSIKK